MSDGACSGSAAEFSAKSWDRSEALREIVRGRLEGLGPTTAAAMANALASQSLKSTPR
jgi:hypothetical protein